MFLWYFPCYCADVPDYIAEEEEYRVMAGERNYTIKLMLQASPALTSYTWMLNGRLLSSGDGITLGADFVTFAVVSETHSGEYTVSGSNSLGTGTVNFTLVVLPFPATSTVDVTETVSTTEVIPNITTTAQTITDEQIEPTSEAFEVQCSHVVNENILSVSCISESGVVVALLCSYDNESVVPCGKLRKDTLVSLNGILIQVRMRTGHSAETYALYHQACTF